MKFFITLFSLFQFVPSFSPAQCLQFYGDVTLSRGIEKFAADEGDGPVFQALSLFFAHDAIHIVNLEGSIGSSESWDSGKPLTFTIKPENLRLLQGFGVVSLENNHAFDAGLVGLHGTANKLKAMGITALAGRNASSVIVTDNGNFGIAAATDVLNSSVDGAEVLMADSPEILHEIRRLREISTAVAVYVHWGRELLPVATDRMKKLAADYIGAGADLVVGAHPHVVGPVALIQGKPVVYSLGNFLFDQKYAETKKGAILECKFDNNGGLVFKLDACETSNNSFLPHPASGFPFRAENQLLSICTLAVKRTWTGIFTRDSSEKRLVLDTKDKAKSLWYMELYGGSTKILEESTPPMPIRKLQPVDLNGDGIYEIMLIQSIYSDFDKETAKRIYICSFDKGFHALWRGTALSRPLIDALFVTPKESRPLLVALHSADSFLLRDLKCKGRVVSIYKWNGFGFTGLKEIKVENDCDGITCISGELHVTKNGLIQGKVLSNQLGASGPITLKQWQQ